MLTEVFTHLVHGEVKIPPMFRITPPSGITGYQDFAIEMNENIF